MYVCNFETHWFYIIHEYHHDYLCNKLTAINQDERISKEYLNNNKKKHYFIINMTGSMQRCIIYVDDRGLLFRVGRIRTTNTSCVKAHLVNTFGWPVSTAN